MYSCCSETSLEETSANRYFCEFLALSDFEPYKIIGLTGSTAMGERVTRWIDNMVMESEKLVCKTKFGHQVSTPFLWPLTRHS
jgi:hypothetical protein